jgi:hypothetical protein
MKKKSKKPYFHLINKNKINTFILFLGFIAYYFEYYILTLYATIHFLVVFGTYFSSDLKKSLENFKQDQITIRTHYLEDFKIFYYFSLSVKLCTCLFFLFFFTYSSATDNIEAITRLGNLFYVIAYLFIVVSAIDLGITLYIIFFKNTPVTELLVNVCYHCTVKGLPMVGMLHMSSNVPISMKIKNSFSRYNNKLCKQIQQIIVFIHLFLVGFSQQIIKILEHYI